MRFVDGGEATGPDEFDATRIGALAACSQLRAPRKRDVAAGRARYYFEASLRSSGGASSSSHLGSIEMTSRMYSLVVRTSSW